MSYLIKLNEENHTYTVNGNPVPSVSDILAAVSAYDRIPKHIVDAAANFGSAVHKACEWNDLGTLDEDSIDPMIEPYLIGWRAFCDKHVIKFIDIEKSLYNPTLVYCGTPDRIAIIEYRGQIFECLIDIKTTAQHMPSTALQTAAYVLAYSSVNPAIIIAAQTAAYEIAYPSRIARMAVRLYPGGFDPKPFEDNADFSVFTSLVVNRNWCLRTKSAFNLEKYMEQ